MESELEKGSVDIDSNGGSTAEVLRPHENGSSLYPVSANGSGEGFPYAPEDFPNPGDKWRWKVGKRITAGGYHMDRYMYLPSHLHKSGPKNYFASKLSIEHYVRENFPSTDIARFFASFSWKIPSKKMNKGNTELLISPEKILVDTGEPRCKAGNNSCPSLSAVEGSLPETALCDLCCFEPEFCLVCCCILCFRIIDKSTSDSYGHIKCEGSVDGSSCGHSCHIKCALRAYMAGTVGGSIGLDAEYYCRRCDTKNDMVPYVEKLLETCESIDSRDDVEGILRAGFCILRGSKRMEANELLCKIESKMSKGFYVV